MGGDACHPAWQQLATRQGIWLQTTTELIPRTYEARLQCALIERQDPVSISTQIATAADGMEDQDTLAYATASQMIGELQELLTTSIALC